MPWRRFRIATAVIRSTCSCAMLTKESGRVERCTTACSRRTVKRSRWRRSGRRHCSSPRCHPPGAAARRRHRRRIASAAAHRAGLRRGGHDAGRAATAMLRAWHGTRPQWRLADGSRIRFFDPADADARGAAVRRRSSRILPIHRLRSAVPQGGGPHLARARPRRVCAASSEGDWRRRRTGCTRSALP